MEQNLFYFINQHVDLKPEIFWNDYKPTDYDLYFPLKNRVKSNIYNRLNYPSNGYIELYEVTLGQDTVEVDD